MFQKYLSRFSTLVLGEHNGKTLLPSTFKVLNAARTLNKPVHMVLSDLKLPKSLCEKIYYCEDPVFEYNPADSVSNLCVQLHSKNNYDAILCSASSFGKDTIPRLAGKLDVQPLTSIIQLNPLIRPIYADNALTKIKNNQKLIISTLRETNFEAPIMEDLQKIQTEKIEGKYKGKIEVLGQKISSGEKVSLGEAKVVISGGRALKSKENFAILDKLAQVFGNAAVGASRAAVDAGYVPNDYQIGQTGKVVAPDLYFAIGISGAIQHVAGMKDSKVIVAINKDPECPMFQMANYSLEGDLFKIIPELTEKLSK